MKGQHDEQEGPVRPKEHQTEAPGESTGTVAGGDIQLQKLGVPNNNKEDSGKIRMEWDGDSNVGYDWDWSWSLVMMEGSKHTSQTGMVVYSIHSAAFIYYAP